MERFDPSYDFTFADEAGGDRNVSVSPKGIDGGDILDSANASVLLQHHLDIEKSDVRAFWKDGFILFKLWVTGTYCSMISTDKRSTPYPWSRDGFYTFLHDHGSQISPDETSRRMKVFRAYNKYEVTIIRLVEVVGVNKAFAAIPHVRDETVKEMLELCRDTPYHKLRQVLQEAFPRADGGRVRNPKTKDQLRRDNEQRAVKAIQECHNGMVGSPALFIPRQYRQEPEDELRAAEVFDIAMKRLGINDRDAFFKRVVDLVAETWLTTEDRQAIEQRLAAQRSGHAARAAYAAE